eukprot:750863-Hanusia_phi.AAC.1
MASAPPVFLFEVAKKAVNHIPLLVWSTRTKRGRGGGKRRARGYKCTGWEASRGGWEHRKIGYVTARSYGGEMEGGGGRRNRWK